MYGPPTTSPVTPRKSLASRGELIAVVLGVFLSIYSFLRFSSFLFTLSDFLYSVSFVLLALSRKLPQNPLGNATPFWFVAYTLLFIGLLLSSTLYGDPIRGLVVLSQYAFSYIVLLYVLARSYSQTKLLGLTFVMSLVLIDIHGIIVFNLYGYDPHSEIVTGANRLATVLGQPNLAATVNALTLPLLLYFWSTGVLSVWLGAVAFFTTSVAVILTSSNNGLLAYSLSLIVYLLGILSRKLVLRLVMIAICIVAVGSIGGTRLLPETFQKRVLDALMSGDVTEAGTAVSRIELMKEAIHLIAERGILLLGVGADQFRLFTAEQAPVHNLYLLLWVEGGAVALFGWMLFPLTAFYIWAESKSFPGSRTARALILSEFSVLLLAAFSNTHLYARYVLTPVILAVALALNHFAQQRQLNWVGSR